MTSCINLPKASKSLLLNLKFRTLSNDRLTSKVHCLKKKKLANLVHAVSGRRFGLIYKYRQIIVTVLSTQ